MKSKSRATGSLIKLFIVILTVGLIAAACGSDSDDETTPTTQATGVTQAAPCADGVDEVSLQLQWFTQAQFAGYYAALDQGLYSSLCLDVTILEGGVEIVPTTVLDSGGSDFAISWVPRAIATIEQGTDIVNIAQVFERSGTLQVSFKDSNINGVADLDGTKVGNWGFGNEFELLAGLRSAGINPDSDVELVQQMFDMNALLNGEIDAAQAMIYNEYAQVLETINPDTGALYQPDDLNIIDWNDVGTAMLQDAIWADRGRLESDSAYRDIAERFVEGSLEGWIWCRDNAVACVEVVLDNAPTLGRSHQTWQLNEINGLIWPANGGVGVMVEALADQTATISVDEQILESDPGSSWYRSDISQAAVNNLEARGYDVNGNSWSRSTVTLLEGGE